MLNGQKSMDLRSKQILNALQEKNPPVRAFFIHT